MTTPVVTIQCQSRSTKNRIYGHEDCRQCANGAEVEMRDFYDPEFVLYYCTGCVEAFSGGFTWTLYDPELHGVLNQVTRQREDKWPLVGTVRVYRPLAA